VDADGLTDVLEELGWTVQVSDAAGVVSTRQVFSNPNLVDTDLDGLPDFAERNMPCTTPPTCGAGGTCSNDSTRSCATASDCENVCPTDPNNPDTDGDGISDFDELSAAQFAVLARYNDFFPSYHIDGSTSKQYGTDPTKVDTDGDGLSDYFELFVGWTVVRDDGSVQQVFSDPTKADTDADGLPDNEELAHRTDPRDPDTDGDGRLDGLEVKIGTNPLQQDIFVAVTYSLMQLTGPQDGSDGLNDWAWRLSVQDSTQRFPGTTLSTEHTDCPPDALMFPAACLTNRFNFFLNRSVAVTLTPNKGIVLNGLVVEINDINSDTQPIDEVRVDKCRMSFIDQPLTYDTLQSGTFMTRTFQLTDPDPDHQSNHCSGLVVAEISVNCVGEGKGFCRVGNPCVTDEDCETGLCGGYSNGVGTCQSVCGNGIKEFAPETLTAPQALVCSLNSAIFKIGSSNCELCDDGNTSDCGTCDHTCGTAFAQGAKTCPVGTGCVADTDCTGTCDPATSKCVAECGNGVLETPEACDDGNTDACGTCNATCTAAGTGATCPIGTGCESNGDCTSGNCVANLCAPASP
jgi:cysteine-rich repeat protein